MIWGYPYFWKHPYIPAPSKGSANQKNPEFFETQTAEGSFLVFETHDFPPLNWSNQNVYQDQNVNAFDFYREIWNDGLVESTYSVGSVVILYLIVIHLIF